MAAKNEHASVERQHQGLKHQELLQGQSQQKAPPSYATNILALQRAAGNRAVNRLLQAKLTVNQPRDIYEQEADRVADQVMGMSQSRVQRKCACGATPRSDGECESCQQKHVTIQRKATASGEIELAPPFVDEVLHSSGHPMDTATRTFMESRFGQDFRNVRVHTDARAMESARAVNALAYAAGDHLVFGTGQYSPNTLAGSRLLAHELAHIVQQAGVGASQRIQRQTIIPVVIIQNRLEYRPPSWKRVFQVGDVLGTNLLMRIEDRNEQGVIFFWYNFYDGVPVSGPWERWDFLAKFSPFFSDLSQKLNALSKQLKPAEWEKLWPNPVPTLLKMYEAGQLRIEDDIVNIIYRGMVAKQARQELDENEKKIDELLQDKEKLQKIQEYAHVLKEAGIVRDALESQKTQVDRSLSLVSQQPSVVLLRPLLVGTSGLGRLHAIQEQERLERALDIWKLSFPLLSRFKTEEITPGRVILTLESIKESIISTRIALVGTPGKKPTLDPLALQGTRERLEGKLGPKTRRVVEEEDKLRSRIALAKAGAMFAVGIAILFLPGGVFVDAALGVAMAAKDWEEAREIGHAANTDLNVYEGLTTQLQALGARGSAILSTIFAVVGVAATSFRVLRVAKLFFGISETIPQLSAASRLTLARLFAREPEALERLAGLIAKDAQVLQRTEQALQRFAGDTFRLHQTIKALSKGFSGPLEQAWMHGLHPDTLRALLAAGKEELETVQKLIRQNPQDAPDILRQFTYSAQKTARKAGTAFVPPENVAGRLTESLANLATARKRGFPFGFNNLGQFKQFGAKVRDAIHRYGVSKGEPHVQGSALHKLNPDDIDVAVLVEGAEFNRLTKQFIDEAIKNGNTELAKTIAKEAAKGKIPWNRFGPREEGFDFLRGIRDAVGGKKVQVSLTPKGGEFDIGPYQEL